MAENSKIEWTDATWNPITGCSVVSPGCTNCYARLNEQWLDQPIRWKRPRRIFVCAHGDLFAEGVPTEWIDKVFAVMALCPQHTFQVLTKRPERMRGYLKDPARGDIITWAQAGFTKHFRSQSSALSNVWLGVSVEDLARATERFEAALMEDA